MGWTETVTLPVANPLAGETVSQLKSTPLVSTITILDVFGIASKVRQDTFVIYEPLLLIALIYAILTAIVVLFFRWLESLIPIKRG